LLPSRVYADDRALDPTFGGNGRVTTDFFGTREAAFDVVVQSDGKIIAGGFALDPVSRRGDFALARYLVDGTLDASFGSGGKVATDFFGGDDSIKTLVLQPDGKIVAAGGTTIGLDFIFAAARYTASGAL